MFKQITLSIAAIALLASCSVKEDRSQCPFTAPVTVRVGDFSMCQEDFPSTKAAQSLSDYTAVKSLTLAFYKSDGTESFKHTQVRDDAETYTTFGEFSCDLLMGSYTMVVVAYAGSSPFTLSSPTSAVCTDTRLQDTFVATQAVNVTTTDALNLSATLSRVVSRLGVISTDNRPANATKLRMTFTKGGRDFSPSTSLSTANTGFANTITFVESVGSTTSSASFLFLGSDELVQDVTLEVLDDDDNVLKSVTVEDVPFKRNKTSVLRDSLFTASSSESFLIESAWLEAYPTTDF